MLHQLKCDLFWKYVRLRLKGPGVGRGRIDGAECGFFGNLFMTLNGIRACEVSGVVPVPQWAAENCLYWDINRGGNAWDYFFEPIRERAGSPDSVRSWRFKPLATMVQPCYDGMNVRATYAELIRRYLVLKEDIAQQIDDFVVEKFGSENPLGCHMRFTDVAAEIKRAVSIEKYWEEIDLYLDSNNSQTIFIATDSAEAISSSRKRYGDRIVYQSDCIRSSDGRSIHGHYDAGIEASPYQKGVDVLIDAYLLSKCAHLIGIHSMVSRFSSCANENQTQHMLGAAHALW